MTQDLQSRNISFFEERTVKWDREHNSIRMIDQTLLPLELRFIECKTVAETVDAIKTLKVRGAPAIGVTGAMGVALSISKTTARTKQELLRSVESDRNALKSARPTAINLTWGVDEVLRFVRETFPNNLQGFNYQEKAVSFVERLADEDVETNKKLSEKGSRLFRSGDGVLTHCN